jgi:hypothetical protein
LKSYRIFIFIIILTSCFWNTTEAQNQSLCTAVVKSDKAKFTFPLPDRKEYTWNQSQTEHNHQEYIWQISLEGTNPQHNYNFGVFLFKFPWAKEMTGNLKKLFSLGQFSVWDIKTSSVRKDLPIDVLIENNRIVIIASDSTFKALFSNKPNLAHFKVQTPYEQLNFDTVAPIEYLK